MIVDSTEVCRIRLVSISREIECFRFLPYDVPRFCDSSQDYAYFFFDEAWDMGSSRSTATCDSRIAIIHGLTRRHHTL